MDDTMLRVDELNTDWAMGDMPTADLRTPIETPSTLSTCHTYTHRHQVARPGAGLGFACDAKR